MKLFLVISFFFFFNKGFTQSLAINTDGSTANASAILDVKSTNKGLLIPRMTKAQKNAIGTPATGLLVFQSSPDSVGFQYYDGIGWIWLDAFNTNGWRTTGNAGTDTSVNFIGTTDNMPLRFKQQNQQLALWDKNLFNFSIGNNAGNNDAGFSNIAMGTSALRDNTNGNSNTAAGSSALLLNTTGFLNTAVGNFAGTLNKGGFENTFIGAASNFGTGIDSLTNATAIGYNSRVDTSNALILGSNASIGIGTSKPRFRLHVSNGGSGNLLNASSRVATFEDNASNYIQLLSPNVNETGILAGNASTLIKSGIVFTADSAIQLRAGGNGTDVHITKNGLIGIGNTNPQSKLHVSDGTTPGAAFFSGASSIIESNSTSILQLMNPSTSIATIISGTDLTNARSSIFFNPDSSIVFNSPGFTNRMSVKNNGDVTIPGELGIGNTAPQSKLHISRGITVGATYLTSATSIFENSTTNFLQLMNPSTTNASILSGTDVTLARSAVNFNADSSLSFSAGGFISRVTIDKAGNTGISTTTPTAKLDVNGTFKLGTVGTVNTALLKNIITIDVASVPANGELDVIVAFANAAVTGAVSVSPTVDLPTGIIIGSARVSSAGNIKIRYRNLTGAAIDPASINYIVSIVQ